LAFVYEEISSLHYGLWDWWILGFLKSLNHH